MVNKTRDYWMVAIIYALAAGAGVATFLAVHRLEVPDPLLPLAIADLIGMMVVFGFSYLLDNASVYDPYWSVAPPLLAAFWWATARPGGIFELRALVVLALVLIWALRLTLNWAVRWNGLQHEDWRYVLQREKHRRAYWPVSFLGIHLMPTILVFLGCLPLLPSLAESHRPWNVLDTLAALLTATAILVEARADFQVTQFKKDPGNQGCFLSSGLWRCSRHPNYLGEVAFWWGLYLFGLAANPAYWWTLVGALAITILFVTISIPMIEKRLLNRYPEYEVYRRHTAPLVPWCRRQ